MDADALRTINRAQSYSNEEGEGQALNESENEEREREHNRLAPLNARALYKCTVQYSVLVQGAELACQSTWGLHSSRSYSCGGAPN